MNENQIERLDLDNSLDLNHSISSNDFVLCSLLKMCIRYLFIP